MGVIITVFLIFAAMAMWAFLSFSPRYANPKQVSVYNWSVIGACAMMCFAWVLNVGSFLAGSSAEKYITFFAVMGAVGVEVVFLGICFVLRNFWIFKASRRPGSRLF